MMNRTDILDSMDNAIIRANNEMENIMSPTRLRPDPHNPGTRSALSRLSSGIPINTRTPKSENPAISTGASVIANNINMPDSAQQISGDMGSNINNHYIDAIIVDKKDNWVSSRAYSRLMESIASFSNIPISAVGANPVQFMLLASLWLTTPIQ